MAFKMIQFLPPLYFLMRKQGQWLSETSVKSGGPKTLVSGAESNLILPVSWRLSLAVCFFFLLTLATVLSILVISNLSCSQESSGLAVENTASLVLSWRLWVILRTYVFNKLWSDCDGLGCSAFGNCSTLPLFLIKFCFLLKAGWLFGSWLCVKQG